MPRKLTMGEFKARQKADAWEHARAHTQARETAETLIEERGPTNALAWAEHCSIRTRDGFWCAVCAEIKRRTEFTIPGIGTFTR